MVNLIIPGRHFGRLVLLKRWNTKHFLITMLKIFLIQPVSRNMIKLNVLMNLNSIYYFRKNELKVTEAMNVMTFISED